MSCSEEQKSFTPRSFLNVVHSPAVKLCTACWETCLTEEKRLIIDCKIMPSSCCVLKFCLPKSFPSLESRKYAFSIWILKRSTRECSSKATIYDTGVR